MAIIKVRNPAIDLDAAEIPNLDASKITTGNFDASRIGSGTFADARIAASSVNQHATSFDDNKLVNDISTLALRQSSNENRAAYNTNSMYVDVFQDATGITNLTNVTRDSNEYISSLVESFTTPAYETGDYSNTYSTVISGQSMDGSSGPIDNWHNNTYNTGSSSTGWYPNDTSSIVGDTITINPANATKIVVGFRMYMDSTASNGSWKIQGSSDGGSNYTDLHTFTWQGTIGGASAPQSGFEESFTNSTGFNRIRFVGLSGNWTQNPWQTALHLKTKTGSSSYNATGSFESNAITAPSSTSSMGAIITYQDQAGTNTLNTDIILKLSADGGSNYSTATLTAMPDFSTGIKMVKVNDLSVTAGTSLKYKIEFANQASGSKEARIRGVSLQY